MALALDLLPKLPRQTLLPVIGFAGRRAGFRSVRGLMEGGVFPPQPCFHM